jgi:hypothetical protein
LNETEAKTRCGANSYLNKHVFPSLTSFQGNKLDPNKVAHPCGMIALNYFKDTYSLSSHGVSIPINESNIALPYLKDHMFKNSKRPDLQGIDMSNDEHFMVWSQMETNPNFIKLWGRIDTTLLQGEKYDVEIVNGMCLSSI